jgi:Tfp pilus assembly protein PilO
MNDFGKKINLNLLIIFLVLAVSFLGYFYLSKLISQKTKEIEDVRNDLSLYNKSLLNLAKLKELSPQVEIYQNKFNTFLPNKDRLIDLPRWISDVARASKVTVNFNFKSEGENPISDKLGYQTFSLEVLGSIEDIENFLYKLEINSPNFLINLDDFSISETNENSYRFFTTGRVFYK